MTMPRRKQPRRTGYSMMTDCAWCVEPASEVIAAHGACPKHAALIYAIAQDGVGRETAMWPKQERRRRGAE